MIFYFLLIRLSDELVPFANLYLDYIIVSHKVAALTANSFINPINININTFYYLICVMTR